MLARLLACARRSPGSPPAPRRRRRRRDHLGALRRGDAAAGRGALEPRPRRGLPRPDLRARERRAARPAAALRDAGPGLPALAGPRRLPAATSRRCSPGCAPRPGSTSPRPATRRRRRSSSRRCRRRRSPGSSRPPPASSCPARPTGRASCAARPSDRLRWPDQATLERAAIFLPLDTTPQDVRDCLNEEITQALGPANDLYRLPDTDLERRQLPRHGDAVRHADPARRSTSRSSSSGMTRDEVGGGAAAASSPAPTRKGRGLPRAAARRRSRAAWAEAIETALVARRAAPAAARGRGQAPTEIAAEMRPVDHRLGVSLLTLGPAQPAPRPGGGGAGLRRRPTRSSATRFGVDDVRTAQAGVHLAALALGDRPVRARDRARRPAPAGGARRAERDPARRAPVDQGRGAGRRSGEAEAAQAARLDSLRWARYGFGDADGALAREQAQLAALIGLENP